MGNIPVSGGGTVIWGSITGTLSAQTDLQSALNAKAGPLTAPYLTYSGGSYGPIFALTPPPSTGWTWANQGSSSATAVNGSLQIIFQQNLGLDQLRAYMRSLPASTNYTVIIGFLSVSHAVGIALSDATKYIAIWQNGDSITAFDFNTATSVGSAYFTALTGRGKLTGAMVWFKIKDDSTHRVISMSADGQLWTVINSQNTATFLTETQFGVIMETNTGFDGAMALVDLRVSTP